jgi:uncharacterized protein with von Willebrand factor type A (vWA) domain
MPITTPPITTTPADTPGTATWRQIERLVADLRRRGVVVSVTEVLDAAAAIAHTDLARRNEFRSMLSAVLVKQAHHEAIFVELFDRHFPVRRAAAGPGPGAVPLGDALERVLGSDLDTDEQLLVEEIVDRYAGIDDGARTERYHLYRTLRAIDLAAILAAAIKRSRAEGVEVDRSELDARVEALRTMIADEIRSRLAALPLDDAGADLQPGRTADPFDVELARATTSELDDIRAAIRPLARRLAAQLRRRHHSQTSGRVDIRRTIHRSLRWGGVPIEVAHRRPSVHRPELFVLCDVSGSVADFSSFTLALISALADELAATRSFAFVDEIDDISALLESATGIIEPWQLLQSGRVIGKDGHSDYGTVLESFWERYGRRDLTGRSTVVIVGDARGNYRPARADIVAQIDARARRVYWLNPEPRSQWDTTDSAQAAYAAHCSAVYEVRTLGQLAAAVLDML